MTDDQAADILAILTAAWPRENLPGPTVELWLGMLCELHYEDGYKAAGVVVREDQWFPSLARFRQAAMSMRHAREVRQAETMGLPTARRGVPPPKRLLDATRQLIAERGSQRHWHGGPGPCPVCGGGPKQARPA